MKENKIYLINKIFNNSPIRIAWNSEEEKYYISVVDIVGILAESKEPRKYWNWLKNKIKKEDDFELSSITRQLKLKSTDGKCYKTDVVDIEGMFRIIESIPSKNAEPIKQWLARLGKERIDEMYDPSLSVQRSIDLYRQKGYDEKWITKRIKGIQDRKSLTDIWKKGGITGNYEFAVLTNTIYKTWSGMTKEQYKSYKGLRKENLRDNMDSIELLLADLGEEAIKRIAEVQKPIGIDENKIVAKKGGNVAKKARDELENELGESVVTNNNKLSYQNKNKQIETK